jgi:hypothetical protein
VPHAHHFLERLDRVGRDQTELALSLYRDHEAVAYVLANVNLPEGATRVALGLDGAAEGPVVVVTRDGRFVTCLGTGMRHDLPVVPRGQLDALLARVADKRSRRELMQRELMPDEAEGGLLQRILTRGSRLSREDFVVLSSFEPLLGQAPFDLMLELGLEATKARLVLSFNAKRAEVNGATRKALEKQHRLEWAVAHLAMLAGAADRKKLDDFLVDAPADAAAATFACAAQTGTTFFLRAAWVAARFGKVMVPAYRATFEGSSEWLTLLESGMALAAIGLRHTSAAGDVRRFFDTHGPSVATPATTDDIRNNVARALLDTMSQADERVRQTLAAGRDFAVKLSAHLPEGHPRRHDEEAKVPDEVARTAALAIDFDILNPQVHGFTVGAVAVAARASAEDFYHPRETIRAWFGAWEPEETLARLRRDGGTNAKLTPLRAEATPGRNEPCSCGSGRKWKKCHGRPGGVP